MQAGCAAAFVARPGKVLYPLAPAPDVVGPDPAQLPSKLSREIERLRRFGQLHTALLERIETWSKTQTKGHGAGFLP